MLVFCSSALKKQCPDADNLLIPSSASENWCYDIWNQYDKLFSNFYEKHVFLFRR